MRRCLEVEMDLEEELCVHSTTRNLRCPVWSPNPEWRSNRREYSQVIHRAEPEREHAIKHGLETRLMDYPSPRGQSNDARKGASANGPQGATAVMVRMEVVVIDTQSVLEVGFPAQRGRVGRTRHAWGSHVPRATHTFLINPYKANERTGIDRTCCRTRTMNTSVLVHSMGDEHNLREWTCRRLLECRSW